MIYVRYGVLVKLSVEVIWAAVFVVQEITQNVIPWINLAVRVAIEFLQTRVRLVTLI